MILKFQLCHAASDTYLLYYKQYSYFHINFTHILGAHTETISDSSNCIITIMHIQNIPTEFLL